VSSATYRTLLRSPGAAAFFLTASTGRVGIAMTSIGIVWLVHARTGSYAAAGLVTGGFAVADALVSPQLARLTDRFGQTRVLPPALLAHAAAVAVLLTLVTGGAPSPLMTAGGVLVGATVPQLGALSAARWAALLRDTAPAVLPSAFALESITNALAYLAGPALVSALGTSGHPALGTTLAACLTVGGGLAFAAQRRTAPPPPPRSTPHTDGRRAGPQSPACPTRPGTPAPSPAAGGARSRVVGLVRVGLRGRPSARRPDRLLLRPGFTVLIGLNLAIGVYFGAMQVSLTAFTVRHGAAATAIFAGSSCGGLLAGWLYGLRRWRAAPRAQLAVVTAWLALGGLLLLTVGSPLGIGIVVALTGGAVPPMLVLFSVLTESTVHRSVLTQAFSWLNSGSAAGSAGAAALCGRVVDAAGARGGFVVAAAATTSMALVAAAGLRGTPRERKREPSPALLP
jgi:hypothetical protein